MYLKDEENKNLEEKDYIEKVVRYVSDIKYGNVTLIIQDGKVIQIDKTEKIRL